MSSQERKDTSIPCGFVDFSCDIPGAVMIAITDEGSIDCHIVGLVDMINSWEISNVVWIKYIEDASEPYVDVLVSYENRETFSIAIACNKSNTGYTLNIFDSKIPFSNMEWLKYTLANPTSIINYSIVSEDLDIKMPYTLANIHNPPFKLRMVTEKYSLNVHDVLAGRYTVTVDIIYPDNRTVPLWRHKTSNTRFWFLNYSNIMEYSKVIMTIDYLKKYLPMRFIGHQDVYDYDDFLLAVPVIIDVYDRPPKMGECPYGHDGPCTGEMDQDGTHYYCTNGCWKYWCVDCGKGTNRMYRKSCSCGWKLDLDV